MSENYNRSAKRVSLISNTTVSGGRPRIAVFGAGGVGGYFGARLAEAGLSVHLIARGAHLAAIRRHGLSVLSPLGNTTLRVPATDDPAEIGPVEAVLFSVKIYDTVTAAATIGPLIGPETVILPLQNGIDAVSHLGRAVGPHAVLGGVAYIFSHVEKPGVIRHTTPGARIVLGEMNGEPTARAQALAECLSVAGIDTELSPRIETEIWTKFVLLTALSALAGLAGTTVDTLLKDRSARALLRAAMEETLRVARRQGIQFDDDLVERQMAFADTLPAGLKPSLLIDLECGRRTEVDALSGAVLRLARQARINTPIHRTAHTAIRLRTDAALKATAKAPGPQP